MRLKLNELLITCLLLSLLLPIFGTFLGSNSLFADYYVGGEITNNTTWYFNESPYIVVSNVTIRGAGSGQTATLIIQPGVQVRFAPHTGIYVGKPSDYVGALIALGSEAQPIVFTSNVTTPSPGDWNSIYFQDQTSDNLTVLEHCRFEYGGNPNLYNTTLFFNSASPTLRNSVVQYSGGHGIYSDDNSYPALTANTFLNNALYPISAYPNSILNITQSTGSGNNPDAIEVRGGEVTLDSLWTNQIFPYELSSNVTICDYNQTQTAALTIASGTRIQLRPQTGFYVGKPPYYKGSLIAQGNQAQPITFTSYNTVSPQPGDWNALYFTDLTNDTLTDFNFCTFAYGGNAYNTTLYFSSASPTIRNSTVSYSSGYGAYSDDNSGPKLSNNQYLNNALYPISTNPSGVLNITQSSGSGNNPDAIKVRGGEVTSDITWTQQTFPYEVTSGVTVYDYNQTQTAVLLINPGTTVRFRPEAGMFIGKTPNYRGGLIAQGNQTAPITFTSYNTTTPQAGDWNALYFTPQANSNLTSLDFCTVEYGGNYYNATVYIKEAAPRINRSTISNSSGYGIYSNSTHTKPVIHNSNIIYNALGGIYSANTTSTNTTIQAQYNWWGDPSGPSGAGNGTGQWISDNVEYEPWLGESFSLDFYLSNISVSPQTFSQDGGWTTFRADSSEAANWNITIEDQAHQMVRTFTAAGSHIEQNWYGDDQNQQALPNGNYFYTLTAESIVHPGTVVSLVGGQLELDDVLPIAKITSPEFYEFLGNDLLSGQFQIIGTASGTNFSSYTLEYGSGESPTQWTTIATSSSPVTNGFLGTWNAAGLTGSVYTIRLTTIDTSQHQATDLITINLLSAYNVYDSIDPFSPNADGFKDDTVISAEFSHLADWLLNITNAGQTVKTFSGTRASSLSQTWDGRDNSQQLLADGNYTYQIQVTEPLSSTTALSQTGTSYLDTTQPTVQISSPSPGANVSGLVEIIGTANDIHFESYKVEYGIGTEPTNWTIIKNTTYTPVINDVLATWDAIGFENGDYVIRLTAKDTVGNSAIFLVSVVINNIQITNVTATPTSFNPSLGETVAINYSIDREATVTAIIQNLFYNIIKIIGPNPRPAGPNSELWDGYNQTGNITADGAYTFTLNVTDGTAFGEYTPDYIPQVVGVSDFYLNSDFDPHSNELCNITYSLADNAQVIIKAGGAGGGSPNWAILDKPRQAGPNVDYWNGRDPYNNVVDLSQAIVAIWANKLPDEPIIVVSDLSVDASTDPYSIIPSYGEWTTITYAISKPANVTVSVYGPEGALVKVLEDNIAKNAGTYEITWDGTDSNNQLVAEEGNYSIKVEATGGDGKTTIKFANVTVH